MRDTRNGLRLIRTDEKRAERETLEIRTKKEQFIIEFKGGGAIFLSLAQIRDLASASNELLNEVD